MRGVHEQKTMAQSLIAVSLSQQAFKRNGVLALFASSSHTTLHHSPPSSCFRSRSLSSFLFFPQTHQRHSPLRVKPARVSLSSSSSSSSQTAMGETHLPDADMDAVQRRLMFEDESVTVTLFISLFFQFLLILFWFALSF